MAQKVTMDSEGLSQVIAKEMELTPEQQGRLSRLADKDVAISSRERFCRLKEEELDDLLGGMSLNQRLTFRELKEQFHKEQSGPQAAAFYSLSKLVELEPYFAVPSHEAAATRPMSQMPMTSSHPLGAPGQVLPCTQRAHFELPLKLKSEEEEHNFNHFEVCVPNPDEAHAEKVILVVGVAGSGMKTLLDFIATVLCGYSEVDKCRVMVPKPTQIGDSGVMPITAYTFPRRKELQFQYTLTIVIPPVFDDEETPACTSANKQLLDRIKGIFFGGIIEKLHGIAYVSNSSKYRLSPVELGVLESMHCIFGDDVQRNLFILNTFTDRGESNAASALHTAGIQFHQAFKFNCSPLLPSNGGREEAEFDRLNWQMSEDSVMRLLQSIDVAPNVNLQSTAANNPEQ